MDACTLCRREGPLTFHHLIPKRLHSNNWFRKRYTREEMVSRGIRVCLDCHKAIHRFIPNEKELGRSFDTRAKLLAHPGLGRFVTWLRGRSTGRVTPPPRRRRG